MGNSTIAAINKKNAGLLVAQVIMAIVMNVSVVLGTGMVARLIDELIQNGQPQFGNMLIAIFFCVFVGVVSSYGKRYLAGVYSISVTEALNDYAVEKLVRIKYDFYGKEGSGKIITKLISDIGEVERYYETTLPDLINNCISIVLVMLYVATQNILLLLISLAIYPIVLVITYFWGKKLKVLANKRRGKIDVMVERITDSIEGIEVIRSYNLYNRFASYIQQAIDDILENEYVRAWITHFSQTLNRLLFWIPNMVCPCVAMYMVIQGDMTMGGMTAYIVLMHKIMGGIKMLPFMLNEFRERRISIERVESILDSPEEEMVTHSVGKVEFKECLAAIEFRNVSFNYDKNDKKVLNNMSFTIDSGKTVAFVGESGNGKTTIFKLLCGFYEKSSGDIFIHGRRIEEIGVEELRDQIAIVEQHPFLFEGTILDNIAVGAKNVSQAQVEEVAKLAGVHEFVMQLPRGYNTVIGENGAGLSGGEKQRITIARALLKDAPILLLDEPTASVDTSAELIIQETIENLKEKRTILIIAHRLSTIKDVDSVMVVKGGVVNG